ncbi:MULTISPECIES: SpoIIE family protein phosphatase [Mammaliicoccus]|uniref:PP2C family protein-serine/threonine phosphatase n=1 Tax=Mammaliicoccus lentus TaxID=42858 RepID=A0AAX3W2B4_MAMLE|nr:PP2C family protein-serine/threonine phosphatase [Mammaliicoccus lentus]MBF0748077.1 PP2C family protein-serine/threonine phosphatase [Mammaliicoccus lentus]MBF0794280.1 PP2C family protein-serine/threonine phosphatase [Mammaliicoccus lentus]MBU6115070.1 PP2C family protein-serine/threonine phosphatase [Mammaliicoccus lentus]MBW0762190.1 PP2C family protein-serine/threonine phosphatase [Mammaliicoccus lentus]MBW0769748.1 PP2C family protein-serine/threonine phosphatase [Mammaliicoccus lentu
MSEQKKQYYQQLLLEYVNTSNDDILSNCQTYSNEAIEDNVSPEEIVQLHLEIIRDQNDLTKQQIVSSFDVLIEVIIGYGFTYRDYKKLLNKIKIHDKEMDVASSLQQTMLKPQIPQFDSIQIGAISVPAQRVSGDYFNLIDHNDGTMSFAVADVIGKGIPAALAMSMIKFGMDSYGHSQLPSDGLKRLNRVVEKNVNQNMFVTMFYGLYEEINNMLYYSSAGHEPGYIYRDQTGEFEEMTERGIVLGVNKHTRYKQSEIKIELQDMIIVFTDGVTELRDQQNEFIKTKDLLNMIKEHKQLHPQDIVQILYEELVKLQNPNKRDDLTILIVKRVK